MPDCLSRGEQQRCPDVPSSYSPSVILLLFFHCAFPWWAQLPSFYTLPPANTLSLLHLGLQKPQIPPHPSWTSLPSTGLTPAPPCPSYMENPELGTALPSADQKERISEPAEHTFPPSWSWPSLERHTDTADYSSINVRPVFSATTFYPVSIQPMPLPSARYVSNFIL